MTKDRDDAIKRAFIYACHDGQKAMTKDDDKQISELLTIMDNHKILNLNSLETIVGNESLETLVTILPNLDLGLIIGLKETLSKKKKKKRNWDEDSDSDWEEHNREEDEDEDEEEDEKPKQTAEKNEVKVATVKAKYFASPAEKIQGKRTTETTKKDTSGWKLNFLVLRMSPPSKVSTRGSSQHIVRCIQSDTNVLIIGFKKLEKDLQHNDLMTKYLNIYDDDTSEYSNIDPDRGLESRLLEFSIHGLCCRNIVMKERTNQLIKMFQPEAKNVTDETSSLFLKTVAFSVKLKAIVPEISLTGKEGIWIIENETARLLINIRMGLEMCMAALRVLNDDLMENMKTEK